MTAENEYLYNNTMPFLRAAVKKYGSIEEIQADRSRLNNREISEEEIAERNQLIKEFDEKIKKAEPENPKKFYKYLKDAKTPQELYNKINNKNFTLNDAERIYTILNHFANEITGYFEAKPERIISLNDGIYITSKYETNLNKALKSRNLVNEQFDPNIPGDKLRVINKAAEKYDLMFSVAEENNAEENTETKNQKSYLEEYNEDDKNRIRKRYRKTKSLIANEDITPAEFFEKWKDGRKTGVPYERLYLGKITDEAKEEINKILGYETKSLDYIISNDDIRHSEKYHGETYKKTDRGVKKISDETLNKLPEILAHPDEIRSGLLKDGRQGIEFVKNIGDDQIIYVQFDNTGGLALQGKTIYINKDSTAVKPSSNDAGVLTSETTAPESLNNNINDSLEDVNNENEKPYIEEKNGSRIYKIGEFKKQGIIPGNAELSTYFKHRILEDNGENGYNTAANAAPIVQEDLDNIHEVLDNPDNIYVEERNGGRKSVYVFEKELGDGNSIYVELDKKSKNMYRIVDAYVRNSGSTVQGELGELNGFNNNYDPETDYYRNLFKHNNETRTRELNTTAAAKLYQDLREAEAELNIRRGKNDGSFDLLIKTENGNVVIPAGRKSVLPRSNLMRHKKFTYAHSKSIISLFHVKHSKDGKQKTHSNNLK